MLACTWYQYGYSLNLACMQVGVCTKQASLTESASHVNLTAGCNFNAQYSCMYDSILILYLEQVMGW